MNERTCVHRGFKKIKELLLDQICRNSCVPFCLKRCTMGDYAKRCHAKQPIQWIGFCCKPANFT